MSKKSRKPKKVRKENPIVKADYRVLVHQPLSLEFENEVIQLNIQGVDCAIAARPIHAEDSARREVGGMLLAVEFEVYEGFDLLEVARDGCELVEDFLSAISVALGTTFSPCVLRQVARRTRDDGKCEFVQFLNLGLKHWHERISEETIKSARGLLAHWDGLENGKRLRRAARQYRDACGRTDDVDAFMDAYIGLEAMEPPLARAVGLKPGTEEIKGNCEKCNHPFTRMKTTLVGVRAFVADAPSMAEADEQRQNDWKKINSLRNDLMHGLADDNSLESRPHEALIPCLHYLHDAIGIFSHAIKGPTEKYRLIRGGRSFIMTGRYTAKSWPSLLAWNEIVETSEFKWVNDPTHGLVPEMSIRNCGVEDLEMGIGQLTKPFSYATMADISPAYTALNPR